MARRPLLLHMLTAHPVGSSSHQSLFPLAYALNGLVVDHTATMAGTNTLPAGTEPIAAIVSIYSAIGWLCTATMIWLSWVHRQRFSCKLLVIVPFAYKAETALTLVAIQMSQ